MTKSRPNTTYVLQVMRDSDFEDPWGTAMSWLYGVCEVLYDADPNMVPARCEYRPSLFGPEVPNGSAEPHRITLEDISYETTMVWCWLHNTDADNPTDVEDLPYWDDPTFNARAEELVWTAKVLDRYIAWCVQAGKDY